MDDLQQTQKDPFAIARSKFDQQQAPVGGVDSPPLPGDPNTPPTPTTQHSSLFDSINSQSKINIQDSKIPQMLQKLGIYDKNLAMNDLGRIQLVGRLKGKYGDNYQQVPEALDVLSAFDDAIKKYSDETRTSMSKLNSSGDRTLKALLGG